MSRYIIDEKTVSWICKTAGIKRESLKLEDAADTLSADAENASIISDLSRSFGYMSGIAASLLANCVLERDRVPAIERAIDITARSYSGATAKLIASLDRPVYEVQVPRKIKTGDTFRAPWGDYTVTDDTDGVLTLEPVTKGKSK